MTSGAAVRLDPLNGSVHIILNCLMASAVTPAVLPGQQPAVEDVLATLSGEWVGTGTLFGQTAEFRMQWNEAKEGKTLFLHFENWILDGDERQPILEALARYSPHEPSQLEGLWIDTRGKRLRLSAEVHEHSLVVFWQGPDEEGKTEYEVISRDAIQVRDFVKQPEGWSQFGMANYRRAVPSDGRPGP